MKTPQGYRNPDLLATTFIAIKGEAMDIMNCINVEAEAVGCDYKDKEKSARYEAQREVKL